MRARPLLQRARVRHNHAHQGGLLRVAVDPDLVQKGHLLQHVLHALCRHVLAVRELEKVLQAVDQLERADVGDLADVAAVEPAVRVWQWVRVGGLKLRLRSRANGSGSQGRGEGWRRTFGASVRR